MQNSQANTEKIFTKVFWRAGNLVNLFLIKLVRISGGFLSFLSESQYFQHILPETAKNTAIAEKRGETPKLLTN